MRRFLYCLFALMVALVATGAELRLPQEAVPQKMDCGAPADGTCPCGMPMPQRSPLCNTSIPSPVVAPLRAVVAIIESAAQADRVTLEPRPWPAAWALRSRLEDERRMASAVLPVDTGPPLLASERTAQLGIFRI